MKLIKKYKKLCAFCLVDILVLAAIVIVYKGLPIFPYICFVSMNVLILVVTALYIYVKGIKDGIVKEDREKSNVGQVILIIFMIFLPVILEKIFG